MQETKTENLNAANEAAEEIPAEPKIELRERELADGEKLDMGREPEAETEPTPSEPKTIIKKTAGLCFIVAGAFLLFG